MCIDIDRQIDRQIDRWIHVGYTVYIDTPQQYLGIGTIYFLVDTSHGLPEGHNVADGRYNYQRCHYRSNGNFEGPPKSKHNPFHPVILGNITVYSSTIFPRMDWFTGNNYRNSPEKSHGQHPRFFARFLPLRQKSIEFSVVSWPYKVVPPQLCLLVYKPQ